MYYECTNFSMLKNKKATCLDSSLNENVLSQKDANKHILSPLPASVESIIDHIQAHIGSYNHTRIYTQRTESVSYIFTVPMKLR